MAPVHFSCFCSLSTSNHPVPSPSLNKRQNPVTILVRRKCTLTILLFFDCQEHPHTSSSLLRSHLLVNMSDQHLSSLTPRTHLWMMSGKQRKFSVEIQNSHKQFPTSYRGMSFHFFFRSNAENYWHHQRVYKRCCGKLSWRLCNQGNCDWCCFGIARYLDVSGHCVHTSQVHSLRGKNKTIISMEASKQRVLGSFALTDNFF